MDNGKAFDRVKAFMDDMENLSPEKIESRAKEIENEIYTLFNSLERLHSLYPEMSQLDMSDDIYSLVRMLEHKKVKRFFPLLARAAAML